MRQYNATKLWERVSVVSFNMMQYDVYRITIYGEMRKHKLLLKVSIHKGNYRYYV